MGEAKRRREAQRYTISADGKAITCKTCGLTSHHPRDVEHRYCGNCHVFHDTDTKVHWLGEDSYVPRAGFCPSCGVHLSGATAMDCDAKPDPGDVSVCVYCAAVLQFGENLVLKPFPNWRDDPQVDVEQVEAAIFVATIAPETPPTTVVKRSN